MFEEQKHHKRIKTTANASLPMTMLTDMNTISRIESISSYKLTRAQYIELGKHLTTIPLAKLIDRSIVFSHHHFCLFVRVHLFSHFILFFICLKRLAFIAQTSPPQQHIEDLQRRSLSAEVSVRRMLRRDGQRYARAVAAAREFLFPPLVGACADAADDVVALTACDEIVKFSLRGNRWELIYAPEQRKTTMASSAYTRATQIAVDKHGAFCFFPKGTSTVSTALSPPTTVQMLADNHIAPLNGVALNGSDQYVYTAGSDYSIMRCFAFIFHCLSLLF